MSSSSRAKPQVEETKLSFFEALYAAQDADANEIMDGLFLGAAAASKDKKAMVKRKISHVLIAHPKLPERHPKSFTYERSPLEDEPNFNLLQHLPDALGFLGEARQKGGKVFVHCAKGISRSSSLVIALIMMEKGISFQEAWTLCEKKRPVVYPNVGFQQQLTYFERLLKSVVDPKASWEKKIKQLAKVVPRGDLNAPMSPLQIREQIGESLAQAIDEVEALVDKVFLNSGLLQKQELWKRQGLLFENLHKYEAVPSDRTLLSRAKAAADKLRTLPKYFSGDIQGVQLALAVAKELEDWVKVVERKMPQPAAETPEPTNGAKGGKEKAENSDGEISDPMPDAKSSKDGKKDKKSKKEKEKSKKEKKLEKKAAKAAKKAQKAIEKIERAAEEAARQARESQLEAERIAEEVEEKDKIIQKLEEEEVLMARRAAAAAFGGAIKRKRDDSEDEGEEAKAFEQRQAAAAYRAGLAADEGEAAEAKDSDSDSSSV